MLDIYVCEDEQKQREVVADIIQYNIKKENLNMEIVQCTDNPRTILQHAKQAENRGCYFIDIALQDEMNGLLLAQKIRAIDPRCFIIFITSHSEMCTLTYEYKTEAMEFILKGTEPSVYKAKIREALNNIHIGEIERCN